MNSWLNIQAVLSGAMETSIWWWAIASVIGAVGITFYNLKNGAKAINAVGKVVLGFGCGFFLGGIVATKLGVDKLAGCFIAAGLSPAIMQVLEDKLRKSLP